MRPSSSDLLGKGWGGNTALVTGEATPPPGSQPLKPDQAGCSRVGLVPGLDLQSVELRQGN